MFWLAGYFSSVNAGIYVWRSLKPDSWLVDESTSYDSINVTNGFLVGSWLETVKLMIILLIVCFNVQREVLERVCVWYKERIENCFRIWRRH